MDANLWWWTLAAAFAVAELMSGAFYLLVLALGAGAGGLVAWYGGPMTAQVAVATIVGLAGTLGLRAWKKRHPAKPTRLDNPDVGQRVKVEIWHEDGSARVHYRGTQWDAVPAKAGSPQAATMYIVAMQGSRLVIADQPPKNMPEQG